MSGDPVVWLISTWIEAAINGPWGKTSQPGSPTTVEERIEQGVACTEAGAAIVHVHAFGPETNEQDDDPVVYARIIEEIRERTDAVVYPTVPPLGLVDGTVMSAEERYAHHEELEEQGLLEWSVVDPGSINFTSYEAVDAGSPGDIYRNPEDHIRRGLEVAERYGSSPSYAIYEPGFVRLGAALAEQYPDIGTPIYRFMFTDDHTFNYPPEEYALESLCRLLEDEAGDVPWMVSGLGVDVTPLIDETVERGGHVRVGLEDAPLGTELTNVQWVERAKERIEAVGGDVGTPEDVRNRLR